MTVQELTGALSLTVYHLETPDRPVTSGYAGDLLSWVLGRAERDCAWLTIMSNQNVAAVALMAEAACVVLTEGVAPDGELLRRAGAPFFHFLGASELPLRQGFRCRRKRLTRRSARKGDRQE